MKVFEVIRVIIFSVLLLLVCYSMVDLLMGAKGIQKLNNVNPYSSDFCQKYKEYCDFDKKYDKYFYTIDVSDYCSKYYQVSCELK